MAAAIYTATLPEENTDVEETIIEEIIGPNDSNETLIPDVVEATNIEIGMYIVDDYYFFQKVWKFRSKYHKVFFYIIVQNEVDDTIVRKTDDASVQTEAVEVVLNTVAVETDAINTSDVALQTDITELADVSMLKLTDLIYL